MKSKVRLSLFSLITTVAVTVILIISTIFLIWYQVDKGFIVVFLLLFMLISGWIYGPVELIADSENITVRSLIWRQRIPVSKIETVEVYKPWIGSIRLIGSGGYMGYWGIYRGADIGRYVAYYGDSSECFLVRMKNGDNYVLGCEKRDEMMKYINQFVC